MQHIPLKNRHQIEFTSLDDLIEKENNKFSWDEKNLDTWNRECK
jgi:hypothetical protein